MTHAFVRHRVENKSARPACLCPVHRCIRAVEQFLEGCAVPWEQGDANRRADRQHVTVALDGLGENLDDPVCQIEGALLVHGHMGFREDRKLVATHAGNRIVAEHRREQPVRHDTQDCIADGVPECVVDRLEAVQIDKKHGKFCVRVVRARLEFIKQVAPVAKACERVALGKTLVLFVVVPTPIGLATDRQELSDRDGNQADLVLQGFSVDIARNQQNAHRIMSGSDRNGCKLGGPQLARGQAAEEFALAQRVEEQPLQPRHVDDMRQRACFDILKKSILAGIAQHQTPGAPILVAAQFDHQRGIRADDPVQDTQQFGQAAVDCALHHGAGADLHETALEQQPPLLAHLDVLSFRDVIGNCHVAIDLAILAQQRTDANIDPKQLAVCRPVADLSAPETLAGQGAPHLLEKGLGMRLRVQNPVRLTDDLFLGVAADPQETFVDLEDQAVGVGHREDGVLVERALVGCKVFIQPLCLRKGPSKPLHLRPVHAEQGNKQRGGNDDTERAGYRVEDEA